MTLTRRGTLAVIGGAAIVAAAAGAANVLRGPRTASLPWTEAGAETEPRRRALSFALLAPNPHNRQPWLVDLSVPDEVMLYAQSDRLLPETDPFNRQITVGLGAFLELMRMAAAEDGWRTTLVPFPEGENPAGLDARPIARVRFVQDPSVERDPLFAHVLERRSTKEPYDITRPVPAPLVGDAGKSVVSTSFGFTVADVDIADLRALTREALRIEIVTPRTFQESVDLMRIGRREVDANPDGIDFTGPLFETLHMFGLFTRAQASQPDSMAYKAGLDAVFANADTAMGFVWLFTEGNTRAEQLSAGADWVRLNLALTAAGIAVQPLSQALQEYPEMANLYADIHRRLAPQGGTVQMLGRIGYGPAVEPSPRWPLNTRILNAEADNA